MRCPPIPIDPSIPRTFASLLARCNDLQSSATRPDFIARFRPAFGETVGVHEPAIGEIQPELTETNLHSSDLAHIP